MRDLRVAKAFARALFNAAQEKKQIRACQQGLEQMLQSTHAKLTLKDVFRHPLISLPEKQRLLHSVLGEFSTPLLDSFFVYLFKRHRFGLLPLIAADFQLMVDRSQHVVAVQVSTAFPLAEKRADELKARLEKLFGAGVRKSVQTDPELIGGFIARSDDFIVDESLKGELRRARRRLAGEADTIGVRSATL